MEQELFDGKYIKEKRLGGGGFSDVWKVTDKDTGVTLALKIYKAGANVDNDGVDMMKHEYALMVNISHVNLLTPKFFAVCDDEPYLVMAYCKQGSIDKLRKKMSEEEAWKLLRDISSALEYLHTRTPSIIHQDIKPDNILIWDDGTYMLTDFGVSTRLKVATQSRLKFDENIYGSAGTIAYMPPNKFSRKNLPIFANDIWSLGATVFEMLTGELPFGHSGGLIQKKGADVPDLPDQFSHLLNDTIRSCMDEDPAKRPFASKLNAIASEALKHPERLVPMSQNTEPEQKPEPEQKTWQEQVIENKQEPKLGSEPEQGKEQGKERPTIPISDSVSDIEQQVQHGLQVDSYQKLEHNVFDSNQFVNDNNKDSGSSIPTWVIILSITGGIVAGVVMALLF